MKKRITRDIERIERDVDALFEDAFLTTEALSEREEARVYAAKERLADLTNHWGR